MVYALFTYPLQLHESLTRPPLPAENMKIEPRPPRPYAAPSRNACLVKGPGPSTVLPSSIGPHEFE